MLVIFVLKELVGVDKNDSVLATCKVSGHALPSSFSQYDVVYV